MESSKKDKILNHVCIILDGNGRWASSKGKNRSYGYRFGSDNVNRIVTHAFKSGVTTLSLYAFSSENWARPSEEVQEIMSVLNGYFKDFYEKILENGVRLVVSGDLTKLSLDLKDVIEKCVKASSGFKDKTLNICLNYGGRQEIVFAVNKLLKENKEITVENISSSLYTAELKEPDLIIRTGGEKRLSNFMLFQGAYSELYFTDVLWPDFTEEEFDKAILSFNTRHRRFGKSGDTL